MIDIIYSSIEDYLNKINELGVFATQLSSGKFLCCQKELKLPKLIIGSRYVSSSLLYHLTLKQDFFCIAIPKGNAGMLVNGHAVEPNQLLVFTLEQEMLIRIPKNYDSHYIIIPTINLTKYLGEGNIAQLKKATTQHIGKNIFIQSEKEQMDLCSLIDNLLKQNELLSYQGVLESQEGIIDSLCKLLTLNLPITQKINISKARRLAIVNRALNHIHKNDAIDITSPELAKISFCSLRNLEYAFKSVLNITPKQYVIKRRLQSIHLALKSEKEVMISDVIKRFGISNKGRFAQDYFKFYEQYPHQTRDRVSLI